MPPKNGTQRAYVKGFLDALDLVGSYPAAYFDIDIYSLKRSIINLWRTHPPAVEMETDHEHRPVQRRSDR